MSIEQKINTAAKYKGLSQAELARQMGLKPANLNLKIKSDMLRHSQIEKIAETLGAKYHHYFEFPDGTRI